MTASALNLVARFQSLDPVLLRQRLHCFAASDSTGRCIRERKGLERERDSIRSLKQVA